MLFGSRRLGSLGADLGGAIRGFRQACGARRRRPSRWRTGKPPAQLAVCGGLRLAQATPAKMAVMPAS
ncbi:MAG: hypothetical protein LRY38_09190 [Aeromonadaceae bacterium]|nr:hypothetical protein [Aeromonadaceae bacterium]